MEAFVVYSLTIFLRRNFAAEKVRFALWNWRSSKKNAHCDPKSKRESRKLQRKETEKQNGWIQR